MHQFWYDYEKSNYGEQSKLRYMNANSFILYIKAVDTYRDIAKDVKTRFDTSN